MTEVQFFAVMMVADAYWLVLMPVAILWVAAFYLLFRSCEQVKS